MTNTEEASVDTHPRLVADLAAEISHSIELAANAPSLPLRDYNCFEFALGVAGRREVRLIYKYLPSTFCDGSFVQHLVDSILISTTEVRLIYKYLPSTFCDGSFVQHLVGSILISTTVPSTGDLVLYRNDGQITHAGLVAADRIISKWGKGHLWIHGLLEVPAQYGDTTSFYEAPPANDMVSDFINFARYREGRELVDSVLDLERTG
jgi:hypothetical protein